MTIKDWKHQKVYICDILDKEESNKVPAVIIDFDKVAYCDYGKDGLYNYSFHIDNLCSYRVIKRRASKPIDKIVKSNMHIVETFKDYCESASNNAIWGNKKCPKKNINK